MEYAFIFAALLFLTAGQLLQKLSANRAVADPIQTGFVKKIIYQHETWWAALCLAIGSLLWLVVLYKMEVSKAFPFLSLGFVFVLLVSRYYLHEKIRPLRWLGVGFICVGILIISQA